MDEENTLDVGFHGASGNGSQPGVRRVVFLLLLYPLRELCNCVCVCVCVWVCGCVGVWGGGGEETEHKLKWVEVIMRNVVGC